MTINDAIRQDVNNKYGNTINSHGKMMDEHMNVRICYQKY